MSGAERYGKRLSLRGLKDALFTNLCLVATLAGIALLAILLYSVFRDGSQRLSWEFLSSYPSRFPERSGIKSALFGSLWVVVLTGLIAVPTGIAAAIYLEEFQRRRNWLTELIQVNISNLAGVPSIVYGLLGLAVFVRWMALDRSVISGALTMSLLILPMLITVSQEALKAVPDSYREGSLALGATQWQTIYRQVLPAALPGILTGVILSLSRALGETAPLILIGAVSFVRFVPESLSSSFTVLPIQIFNWTSQPQKGFQEAAAAGIIVLLVVLLSLNAAAIILRQKASRHH
ncbi:MAG: phosphate ABC transporter permease PstA [Fimbriimonadales bacterium]|nr:phosphate ABC transporter permease PstA [Fimbriimonadales bacterium]